MTFDRRYLSLPLDRSIGHRPGAVRRQALAALLFAVCLYRADAVWSAEFCNNRPAATHNTLQRIVNEWPLRGSSDYVTQYVQELGMRVAHGSGRPLAGGLRFSVVRNLAPNAFSIGGGHVFVTEGAVRFAQNESELAAILAHELGHELAGHFCAPVTEGAGGFFDLFSSTPSGHTHAGVGSLTQVLDPVKEQQADNIALSLLRAGGYDPRALLEVAQKMPSNAGFQYLKAHRTQYLNRALTHFRPVEASNSAAFFAVKRRLDVE
jgi:predicted Zn-dependent protease